MKRLLTMLRRLLGIGAWKTEPTTIEELREIAGIPTAKDAAEVDHE